MSTEKLDSWVTGIREASDIYRRFLTGENTREKLDDSFGWGSIMQQFLNAPAEVRPSGVILTGKEGVGKHHAAAFLIQTLARKKYDCLFLNGQDLNAGSDQEIADRINKLIDDLYDADTGKGLCLLLEDLSECEKYSYLMRFLSKTILQNRITLADGAYPIFLIFIGEEEIKVPAALRKTLQVFRLGLPKQENRIAILNRNENLHYYIAPENPDAKLSIEDFAQETEGLNYNQLLDISANLELEMTAIEEAGGEVTDQDIWEIIQEQLPFAQDQLPFAQDQLPFAQDQLPFAQGQLSLVQEEKDDWKKSLANDVSIFLKELPEVLKNLPAASYVPQQVFVSGGSDPNMSSQMQPEPEAQLDENVYKAPSMEDLDKMPTKDLANDLFGEDRTQELIRYCMEHV